jgi:hypothetical protein
VAYDFVIAILREFRKWIMVEAGIIAILGLAAWIGSYFIKGRNEVSS